MGKSTINGGLDGGCSIESPISWEDFPAPWLRQVSAWQAICKDAREAIGRSGAALDIFRDTDNISW